MDREITVPFELDEEGIERLARQLNDEGDGLQALLILMEGFDMDDREAGMILSGETSIKTLRASVMGFDPYYDEDVLF